MHILYSRYADQIRLFERPHHLNIEGAAIIDDHVSVVMLGMGRVSLSVYHEMQQQMGDVVVAAEENIGKAQA